MAGAPNVPHYLVDLTDDNDEEERQEGRDEEMDDGEPRGDGAGPAPTRTQRIALHDFLRMIAGQQMMQGIPSSNNEEMVGNLRRTGVLTR